MQLSFEKYRELNFVVGNVNSVNCMLEAPPLRPFADEVVNFLNQLSKIMMSSGKRYSDVATFAFWCRRAAILAEKNKYDDISNRFGKGIVFHIAPSNVPVNFAFSFAAGLLAGNGNIVRIPSKDFDQVNVICDAINELLIGEYADMLPYVCMVRYPSSSLLTDVFSSFCDSRIIWGGDDTISIIRKSQLKPRASEITFADRYSIAVINADEYLNSEEKNKIVQDFYNDTYFSDQNACSSPRIIFWLGERKADAKSVFWNYAHMYVREKYNLAPVQSVGKYNAFCKIASQLDVKLVYSEDQFITRISVAEVNEELMQFRYNSGFFFEYDVKDLSEIIPLCSDRCQTLTYYGLGKDEILKFLDEGKPKGIDRIVPIGKSMDFSLIWDGHDLIRELSRKVMAY